MKCEECGAESYIVADGVELSKEELSKLKTPPRKIERFLNHQLWCTKSKTGVQRCPME